MAYSIFADYSKKAAHWAIECTFPSNAFIASVTGCVSWYSYQVGMTYSQGVIVGLFVEKMGSVAGYATAPLFVPTLAPYISLCFSVGAGCATSLTLNLIALAFFKIKSCLSTPKKTPPTPQSSIHVQPGTRIATKPINEEKDEKELPPLHTPIKTRMGRDTSEADNEDDPLLSSECCWNLCCCLPV